MLTPSNKLEQVYLDANATTPVLPKAADAALEAMQSLFGNPSSSHVTGLQAKNLMETTRTLAKKLIGSGDGKLIFTSGATEGIQTSILSALIEAKQSLQEDKKYTLLYGATEHKAVPNSLEHWNQILGINANIKAIPVDKDGNLDTEFIAAELPDTLLICTMAVNNETGVYQDLEHLDRIIRQTNSDVYWMVDCVQALGKLNLDLASTSIDYAVFSGHKLYAPKGIGLLYARENAPFTPFIAGGGQESGYRSGTENLPGLAALKVIFSALTCDGDTTFAKAETLVSYRQQLSDALHQAFPQLVFNHSFENSVPTTLNFSIPGFSSKEIMDLFDAANIRVSSGSACSSKVVGSFVLDAMGLPLWQSESAIRLSFGPAATQTEIDQACERIIQAAEALTVSCLTVADDDDANKEPMDGLVQLKSGGNCTWLYCDATSKQAVVIDIVPELVERIGTLLTCQQFDLVAAIDSHGHADHESGGKLLTAKFIENHVSDSLGWPTHASPCEVLGEKASYIPIGNKYLINVPLPGHTDDSIGLFLADELPQNGDINCLYAFAGDTILMGSLGRTNFENSSTSDMYHSLQKLGRIIEDDTLICSSHDYYNEFTTTLAVEKQRNSLLNQTLNNDISLQQFIEQKTALDSHIQDESGQTIMCGAYTSSCPKSGIIEYNRNDFEALRAAEPDLQLVDIREPHEYALQHDFDNSINVPITKLVQFFLDHQDEKDKPWILICRSGTRSKLVAEAFTRLGFSHVAHLKGGYALHQ